MQSIVQETNNIYIMVIYATLMKVNIKRQEFITFSLKACIGVDMYFNSVVISAIDVSERTTSRPHHFIHRKESQNTLNKKAGWLQRRYGRL
jgi:hypothetical protein